jgi:regulator of sigma E protease
LLPIPLLDGGHLLYYLWEALNGKPASALWQERLSIMGMVIIFSLVFLTFFNDFLRWFR